MRIFLSYARADQDRARALATQFTNAGHDVWDPEDNLGPGDNSPLKIGVLCGR
jgi:hypothetical protein